MAKRRRKSSSKGRCKCVRGKKVCWTARGKFKKGKRKSC